MSHPEQTANPALERALRDFCRHNRVALQERLRWMEYELETEQALAEMDAAGARMAAQDTRTPEGRQAFLAAADEFKRARERFAAASAQYLQPQGDGHGQPDADQADSYRQGRPGAE